LANKAIPHRRGKTTTFVVGPRLKDLAALAGFGRPVDPSAMEAHVARSLAPSPRPGELSSRMRQ
jgi:hypothetical protein